MRAPFSSSRVGSRRARRALVAGGSLSLTAALMAATIAPGMAAQTVARASASAITLEVGGQSAYSGQYRVTNDGKREHSTGNNKPQIQALGGQSFLSVGTLAQDAKTDVVDGQGRSAACAGLAGRGASLAQAGEGNCLTPGRQLDLSAGTLDLSNLTISKSDLLMGLDTQLQAQLQPLLDQVLPAVQDGLTTALTQLGDPQVRLSLGAIQSKCMVRPGSVTGDADLADVNFTVQVAGNTITLLKLPVHPAPNTKIVTGLDQLVDAIDQAVSTQLKDGLNGALGPAAPLSDQLIQAINDNVIKALAPQLKPLEQNLLSGTLNEQRRGNGSITVTALDLHVLPAAQQFAGFDLARLRVGTSSCGPNGRVVVHKPAPPKKPKPVHHRLPTYVPAGLGSAPSGPASTGSGHQGLALAGVLALLGVASAVGVGAYRRAR